MRSGVGRGAASRKQGGEGEGSEGLASTHTSTESSATRASIMASNAPVQWAQRHGSVYFTIVLPDVKEPTIDLQEDKLTFR